MAFRSIEGNKKNLTREERLDWNKKTKEYFTTKKSAENVSEEVKEEYIEKNKFTRVASTNPFFVSKKEEEEYEKDKIQNTKI